MNLTEALSQRILVLDGAMGTMLQNGFSEEETLQAYVDAGADIITTNTFALDGPELLAEATAVARKVADRSGRRIWVAGSIGPTGKSLTLDRTLDFDSMAQAFRRKAEALRDGGVDLLLLETNFDALNTKAAIYGLVQMGNTLPVIISATVSDSSGRTLTGQTLEAFYRSIEHCPQLCAFGINCALGAEAMKALVRDIASFSSHPVCFYPNAGIPDAFGRYNDSPSVVAKVVGELAGKGMLNIVGGCCGTTPAHIAAIAEAVRGVGPRKTVPSSSLVVSGLEAFSIDSSRNFTNIGERTNVTGSRKFAGLVAAEDWKGAMEVAEKQISGGAGIIDVCMDDGLSDSASKMKAFLQTAAGEPDVAKAAVMIDSSHWETVLAGLKSTQGKCIVNSISLKDGEEEFIRKAKIIDSLGAAMVVMAFDEKGQAETLDRKIEICGRSYRLLTQKAGILPHNIIFDCNILAVGTDIESRSRYGIDFIEAVRWIKQNLNGALTSGGVSNLSFAFRGNNTVREAMHAVFLYHAIKAGLDMAIVNPQMIMPYDEVDPQLRKAVEDVILDSCPEATAALLNLATEIQSSKESAIPEKTSSGGREQTVLSPEERLSALIVRGRSEDLERTALECLNRLGDAVAVIEGPLMAGMEEVGKRFADGRMFLPQIVKSARTMRDAVALLQPYMKAGANVSGRPVFVLATVQGDVHDIGKNITGTVLQCSGFEVVDLGVMVPAEEILRQAEVHGADIIGVSGLISPSLRMMEELCSEMAARGLDIPLFVGGAAASALHTAIKLAPIYPNVHYGADASATAVMAKKYLQDRETFILAEDKEHGRLAALADSAGDKPCCNIEPEFSPDSFAPADLFEDIALESIDSSELMPFFDWRTFAALCGLKGKEDVPSELKDEAIELADGLSVKVSARFFNCKRIGDCLEGAASGQDGLRLSIPMLAGQGSPLEYFSANDCSTLGLVGISVKGGNDGELVSHAVNACLAEAASESLQSLWKKSLPEGFKLVLDAIGYPCIPDHTLKRDVLALLDPGLGIELSDTCAMIPEASICGLVFIHKNASYQARIVASEEQIEAYATKRNFSREDRELYLGQLRQI